MDETTAIPKEVAGAPAGSAPADWPADMAPSTEAEGVVIRTKKKSRRYSRGLRGPQRTSRRLAKASHKLVRAVSSGLSTYRDREDRSSRKKRDGAIKDGLKNWARAMGKTMRKSSNVPFDIARAFDTKANRRNVRAAVRAVSSLMPFR